LLKDLMDTLDAEVVSQRPGNAPKSLRLPPQYPEVLQDAQALAWSRKELSGFLQNTEADFRVIVANSEGSKAVTSRPSVVGGRSARPNGWPRNCCSNTGLRQSDAVRLGRPHMTSDGKAFEITAVKTGTPLYIPIHPDLRPALATAPAGHLTSIVTAQGAQRSPKAFTGWLKEAARAAGLPPTPRLTVHGRPLCARLADAGCTRT
jgi:integrase